MNLDCAASLESPAGWVPLAKVEFADVVQWYFDVTAPLPAQRFYRAWQSGPPTVLPALAVHKVPAILLTGSMGSSVRLDYINQSGPTDAWVTLATISLTNTPQLYFDTSAIGQPPRLYRIQSSP